MTAPPAPAPRTIRIPVTGMTCAACQSRVQRTLQKQPGVSDATVNLILNDATVTFDPATTSPEALVEVIRDVGYGASLAVPDQTALEEQDARDDSAATEYLTLRRKAIVSGIVGLFAMIISMPLMSQLAATMHTHGGAAAVGDPFMRWTMTVLDPALRRMAPWMYAIDPRVTTWLLLVLTVGVMTWAGRHFYTHAWSAFRHHAADMNTLIAIITTAAGRTRPVATSSTSPSPTRSPMSSVSDAS